ncbi:DUF72 domain-containing protein [Anaeromyxobacter diazotrophicus]|uniref:DUF72 domain-containing protein n=1 Tax=Anaeromyxobacter diazotrophicus TaxID=2590199 RepID=A0A7I9VRS1_9BACT|nr:DUF72 domain-containing protein [Anaeromyxobacter diazotrophicus]GEJ59061.1 hypothetical protein AMYX_38020 [Anaeromyxobacter diazotrophicus]
MGRVLVGTSGFVYQHWRGVLYPRDLPPRRWLARYAAEFPTVELNATFYRLPRPEAVARWRAETPDDFVFAAKGSRYLTHMKRLLDPRPGVARYFEPVSRLGPKLAVVLWQLPPRWSADAARLDAFLAALPRGLRHAVEFRDARWYDEAICEVLDRHGAAFCEHDLVPRPPPRLTGGFRYLRFHGTTGRYRGRYGAEALAPVARDLARSAARGDAFVYFNNDLGGHAIQDARDLLAMLPREVREPRAQRAAPLDSRAPPR